MKYLIKSHTKWFGLDFNSDPSLFWRDSRILQSRKIKRWVPFHTATGRIHSTAPGAPILHTVPYIFRWMVIITATDFCLSWYGQYCTPVWQKKNANILSLFQSVSAEECSHRVYSCCTEEPMEFRSLMHTCLSHNWIQFHKYRASPSLQTLCLSVWALLMFFICFQFLSNVLDI